MKIGFIGLGIMGESMCENLIKKSRSQVFVYDKDKNKVKFLLEKGAFEAESISEIAKECDVIISMVPKSEHVTAVYSELLPYLHEEQICIDMSTIDPEVSINLSRMVAEKKAVMLDAPVVKSKSAAISGTLGIYVGGDLKTFEKIKDILYCMGNNVIQLGKNGSGLYMKIAHNMLVAQIQNSVNEMFVFAEKVGLDISQVPKAIAYGGGQNFYLDTKYEAITNENFTTAFSVENMYKDVNIAVNIKNSFGLNLPGFEVAKSIYDDAMEANYCKEDFSATYMVVKGKQPGKL